MSRLSVPVHVEVSLLPTCTAEDAHIREETLNLLSGGRYILRDGPVDFASSVLLSQSVKSVAVVDMDDPLPSGVSFWQGDFRVHTYRLSHEGAEQEMIEGAGEEEEIAACDQWILPAASLEGVWESLVLEQGVKNHLLEYATSALLFTDKGVRKNVISWNRVVLLHGPPGTGKTSLCKALAHKLSIRLGDRYSSGQLLEINAHSLFSKWFSESGKLVQRLFEHILELADDEDSLVCVLVDEVESLTAARSAAMGGNEPSDAVRVVNAVLTQIDNLRERDNVLVLTTSNVSEAIDLAFVDRADIKQYIGLPTAPARYQVLHSCLEELVRVGIISPPFYLPPSFSKAVELTSASPLSSSSPAAAPTASSPSPPLVPPRGSTTGQGVAGVRGGGGGGVAEQQLQQKGSRGISSDGWDNGGGGGGGGGRGESSRRDLVSGNGTGSSSSSSSSSVSSGNGVAKVDCREDVVMDGVGVGELGVGGGGPPRVRTGLHAAAEGLLNIARLAEGLSGRALRKLPFQAHAFYVQRQSCTLTEFLSAMTRAVHKELGDRRSLETHR
ncbi:unnamed protein product [Pylaiella littoralis]